ncbi:MAG: tetratricopeptide repeat protein, partial [Gemmatimonadetes bacterium]|nr:tetratricopeptide repeat protein [Gemmatimonadota bacterium]NIQ60119.1 tetratricopeptide repeat protein [Gemmatimonadota bacterium]NIU80331.1 tetratricopeptide repeat protein [Gammaproteobacteria bacterium]NIX48690.1 tetratricopeptide repeat protein [Gemmatimonadota bacterium]NIY13142.1 tetratricopeptide repeat protein [Gemmatimonadota bacterium]
MSRDRWSPRDRLLIGGAVFVLALVVRLLHVWSIADAPFFALRVGDAADHHQLGLAAAAGDWLGSEVFFHAPLYPYFLGVVYSLFGSEALTVRVVQAGVGALSCVLVAQAAGRLFSRTVAIAAGVLLALYGPAIFYDTVFQDSVLDLFFGSLSLWLLVEAALTRRPVVLLAAGVALGAFHLTRENAIILLVPILVWVALQYGGSVRRRAAAGAFLLAGVALALAPVAIRNAAISGAILPGRQLQLGINLYIGNNPGADGYYRPLREGRGNPRFEMRDAIEEAERAEGRELTLAEVSDHWVGETVAYVVDRPGDWLALMARKAALAVNAVEAADTEDLYTYAEHSPILAVTGWLLSFGVLLALAVLGAALTWPERRRLALFHALPVVYLAGLVAFFVFGRYRHPVTPFLVVLAAPGIAGLPALLRERGRARVAGPAAALAVLALAHVPVGFSRAELRAHTHANVGAALEERGDREAAARQYMRALEIDPRSAQANQFLGDLIRRSGRPDAALPYLERAARADPRNPRILNDHGVALAALGRETEAAERLRRAVALDPALAAAHLNLGLLVLRSDAPGDAAGHFRRAVDADPGDGRARRLLAAALLLDDDVAGALAQVDTLAGITSPETAADALRRLSWELVTEGPP